MFMVNKKSVFDNDVKKAGFVGRKDGFLEEDEHEESSEDFEKEIEEGDKDADVYTAEGQENLVDNDEIEPWEEGFSEGAKGNVDYQHCANCEQVLTGEDFIEREVQHDKILAFCSEECAEEYAKKKKTE